MITTYQDINDHRSGLTTFDLIICTEAQFMKNEDYFNLLITQHSKFLGILPNSISDSPDNWFNDAICLFSYTTQDAIKDGYNSYAGERDFIQRFLIELLNYQGYEDISEEVAIPNSYRTNIRADIVAKKDNKEIIFEVKIYRNLYNSQVIIKNALSQILEYKYILLKENKNKELSFIIVLPCEIDEKLKYNIYKYFNIVIWDISNLIYLCEDNKKLLQLLISCTPYPSLELKAKKPIGMKNESKETIIGEPQKSLAEIYSKKLEKCKPGKLDKADKEYETICTEIIKCLFETEFFKISEQHKTNDEMFRMDLLCSLKGTTEFWRFLISFYKTKFVVFEYKNYSDYIPQNLIYLTEKYLFPIALRNVAFIISRKGFDPNAEKAALGCLRESGKLIISLDDNDLLKMLTMKSNGEEPSDYLLDKVEQFLMSVSK